MDTLTMFINTAGDPAVQTKTIGGLDAISKNHGDKLTLLGMVVVFSGLVILTLVLYSLPGVIKYIRNIHESIFSPEKARKQTPDTNEQPHITGEEAAAICTAILLYHRMHMADRRQKLTMRSELKMLSPWALAGKIQRTGRTLK